MRHVGGGERGRVPGPGRRAGVGAPALQLGDEAWIDVEADVAARPAGAGGACRGSRDRSRARAPRLPAAPGRPRPHPRRVVAPVEDAHQQFVAERAAVDQAGAHARPGRLSAGGRRLGGGSLGIQLGQRELVGGRSLDHPAGPSCAGRRRHARARRTEAAASPRPRPSPRWPRSPRGGEPDRPSGRGPIRGRWRAPGGACRGDRPRRAPARGARGRRDSAAPTARGGDEHAVEREHGQVLGDPAGRGDDPPPTSPVRSISLVMSAK